MFSKTTYAKLRCENPHLLEFGGPVCGEELDPEDLVWVASDGKNAGRVNREIPEESMTPLKEVMKVVRAALRVQIVTDLSSVSSIVKCVKVWMEIFYLYGFRFSEHETRNLARAVTKTAVWCHSLEFSMGINFVEYFKYKNAAFFSAWMQQELPICKWDGPEAPFTERPEVLFGGPFHMFVRKLRRDDPKRLLSFCVSILMSKKGMERPTDEMVKKAEEKAFIIMTTPKPQVDYYGCLAPNEEEQLSSVLESYSSRGGVELCKKNIYKRKVVSNLSGRVEYVDWDDWTLAEAMMDNYFSSCYDKTYKEQLCRGLERTIREVFSDEDQDNPEEPWNKAWLVINPELPSLSANFNRSCRKGGGLGFLDKEARQCFRGMKLPSKVCLTGVKDYLSLHYGRKGVDDTFMYDPEDGRIFDQRPGIEIDERDFLERYKQFYSMQFLKARDEEALVEAIGLKEALKIRVISKGPPRLYFVLKPIQKFMWRRLQRFWQFELTGRTITEDLINRRFGRPDKGCRFSSGDYSAATDELHSWVSEVLCAELIRVWEEQSGEDLTDLHWLMLKALTGHGYISEHGEIRAQARGQLMGSIISFVFLCLANITLIRESYEIAHDRTIALRDLPSWVNGDDCFTLYKSPSYPKIWEGLGMVMGLTKSVGKSYDSKEFGTVNSRFFKLDYLSGQWKIVPFVNMGQACGLKRSVVGESGDLVHPLELQEKYRELKSNCGDIDIDRYFLYKNGDSLREAKLPYGIPQHFCGLGISSTRTTHEMRVVTVLREMYLDGEKVPKVVTNAEFNLHREVMDKLKRRHPEVKDEQFEKYGGDDTYGCAYTSLCYESWAEKGYEGLCGSGDSRGYDRSMNQMRRLWGRATKHLSSFDKQKWPIKPTSINKLERETKHFAYPLMTMGF